MNIWDLEYSLIPASNWTPTILSKFPENIQDHLNLHYNDGPIGIGWHEEVGWYCLASGQGPFVVWNERGEVAV